ncbi:MAG: Smr/MutS family protein [Thermoanaerobaculia bacterium]
MQASSDSSRALEFASLKQVAAEFAVCDLGRTAILAARPIEKVSELRRSLAMTQEIERLVESEPLVRGFDEDLAPLGELVTGDHAEVKGRDLLLLAGVLTDSRAALDRVRADEEAQRLQEAFREVPDLGDLAGEIDRTIDERGRVRDDASPRLKKLSTRSRTVRRGLYSRLGEFVTGHRDNLAEETVSVQDGRLVLMLRSGSKGRLPGVVQGRSGTGKSFYFEPLEFVEENNELNESQREEEAERHRIFTELLARVRSNAAGIRAQWSMLAELDSRQALVRFKKTIGGHFVEPREGDPLELLDARHPLLDPVLAESRKRALGQAGHTDPVVPLVLQLAENRRMLVVTGPNAGGKTVALKTAGLLAVAAHCGFPLPVALHSRLPFLTRVVAVVGDEQDLLEERSTFSGRLLRLREVWDAAGPDSLLLVDELGSGTDPAEGSALGIALVEGLSAKRPWTVITTHLTAIAAAALELEAAACAAMEFDSRSGRPTYRLVPGAPGASEALALARRLDLPDAWLSRAEDLLGPEERRLRKLLQEVEATKRALESEREELGTLRSGAESDRLEAADELAAAAREKAVVAKRLKRELREFRDRVKRRLSEEVERVETELRAGRKKAAAREAIDRLFEDAPELEDPTSTPGPLPDLGDTVEHSGFGWRGELIQLDGERATVSVYGKRVTCEASELAVVGAESSHRAASSLASSERSPALASDTLAELMLVGQRVEPALEELERFLDRALLESRESVRIVHGHGTGRLRKAIRERLRGHAAVANWRPGEDGEGGDGATVVSLAG